VWLRHDDWATYRRLSVAGGGGGEEGKRAMARCFEAYLPTCR